MSGQDCGAPESVHGARPEKAPMVLPNVHGGSKVDQKVPPAAGPPPSSHGPKKGVTAAEHTGPFRWLVPQDVVASFALATVGAFLFCVFVLHEPYILEGFKFIIYMYCELTTMAVPRLMLAIGGARPGVMRMGRIVVVTGVLPSAGAWVTCWATKHAYWGGSGGGFAGYS